MFAYSDNVVGKYSVGPAEGVESAVSAIITARVYSLQRGKRVNYILGCKVR